jgi:hypothetical protein
MSWNSGNTVDTVVSNLERRADQESLDGMLVESRAERAMRDRWSDEWPPALHKRPLVWFEKRQGECLPTNCASARASARAAERPS